MTPFNIGNVQIKNRFVMGPMGMEVWQKDEQCGWTDGAVAFFEERAKGGFGAIYTGCQSTDVGVDMFPGTGHVETVCKLSRKIKES